MKITLKQAYELLENAVAVVVDGVVTYPSLSDLTGEADNQWLNLSWTDERGLDYEILFIEEDQEITLDGSHILMKDNEDDVIEICLLEIWNAEKDISEKKFEFNPE